MISEDDLKGRRFIATIHTNLLASRRVNNRVVELAVLGGRDGEALDILNRDARPLELKLLNDINGLIEYQNERTAMRYEQAVAAHQRARKTMW